MSDSMTVVQSMPTVSSLTERKGIRISGHVLLFGAATGLAMATAMECRSVLHIPSLIYGSVLWLWWAVLASLLWKISQSRPMMIRVSARTIAAQFAIGAALGYVHLLLLWSLGFTEAGWEPQTARSMWQYLININRLGIEVLLYGFVLAMVGVLQYRSRAQRDALRALELERQLSAAHLHALQMQLEPHFLFNSLNAITTLVELGRQKEAAKMLGCLNAMLKATLQRPTPEKVPLSQELELVENYLAIEQVRFSDRLHLDLKVDPSALSGLVPCFLLQPIVENAIRHGIAPYEDQGCVEAEAVRNGEILQLRIRNSGGMTAKNASHEGHGIGLTNTRERLSHFYAGSFAMTAAPLAAGGFEVAISIPYEPCSA